MLSPQKLQTMKYLKKEFDQLQNDPILALGVTVGLPDPSNIFHWKISLSGPQDTPYAGGLFFLTADFPDTYPQTKPEIRFVNKEQNKGLLSLKIALNLFRYNLKSDKFLNSEFKIVLILMESSTKFTGLYWSIFFKDVII